MERFRITEHSNTDNLKKKQLTKLVEGIASHITEFHEEYSLEDQMMILTALNIISDIIPVEKEKLH